MSVLYRSTVGCISVNCRWYIGQLSFEYQSCVNLSGEFNGFIFLSKDVINYCYHAMAEHVAVRGEITLQDQNGENKGRRKSEKKAEKSKEIG